MRCHKCLLVFVPPAQRLGRDAEKAEYEKHENTPDDPGYRRFLGRLFDALIPHLPPGSEGLDFGCGPGPTLSLMFREAGFPCADYDIFFAPDDGVFEKRYQFITATEVVEHLSQPGWQLRRLWDLLQPGGHLGLMTKLVKDSDAFSRWHYKNDPTHICFFSRETFTWLANHLGAELEIIGADVILLGKPNT